MEGLLPVRRLRLSAALTLQTRARGLASRLHAQAVRAQVRERRVGGGRGEAAGVEGRQDWCVLARCIDADDQGIRSSTLPCARSRSRATSTTAVACSSRACSAALTPQDRRHVPDQGSYDGLETRRAVLHAESDRRVRSTLPTSRLTDPQRLWQQQRRLAGALSRFEPALTVAVVREHRHRPAALLQDLLASVPEREERRDRRLHPSLHPRAGQGASRSDITHSR